MADVYVDAGLATGLNDGSDWTNAFQTFETYRASGLTADDRVYIMGGTGADVIGVGTLKAIAFDATFDTPVLMTAVLSGTTNTPPQLADIIPDRFNADVPIIEVTGTGSGTAINIRGYIFFHGIHFRSGRFLRFGASSLAETHIRFSECIINNSNEVSTGALEIGASGSGNISVFVDWENCTWRSGAATIDADHIQLISAKFVWNGGDIDTPDATSVPNVCFASQGPNIVRWTGVDLSASTHSSFFEDSDVEFGLDAILERCKIPSGFTPFSGSTFVGEAAKVTFVACDNTADHTAAIEAFTAVDPRGTVEVETTVVRTGGGSDGDNSLAYKMTPRATASTKKGVMGVYSQWAPIWITTADTSITAYMMIQLASQTPNMSEIWLEVMKPNEGVGSAGSDNEYITTRELPVGGTLTSVPTDTSTWAGGGSQSKFKIVHTIAPEYDGPLMMRIGYAPESTQPLFIESLPDLA